MTTTFQDPILNLFTQSKQFKALCDSKINEIASMTDIHSEFPTFWIKSFEQLDHFFSNRVKITDPNVRNPNTHRFSSIDCSEKMTMGSGCNMVASTKRFKAGRTDYVERLLIEYGYANDEQNNFILLSDQNKKTLPISDERILIKLNNPSTELERDLGPKYDAYKPTTGKKKKVLIESKNVPKITLTESSPGSSGSNKENIMNTMNKKGQPTTKKIDMTFQNSNGCFDRYSPKPTEFLKPIDEDQLLGSKTKSEKKRNLRKSLLNEFEQASRRESVLDEVKLPSEDTNCNRELEEMLTKLTNFQLKEGREAKEKFTMATTSSFRTMANDTTHMRSTNDNSVLTENPSGNLFSNVRNILYSKNNFFEEGSDVEEDNAEDHDDQVSKSAQDEENSQNLLISESSDEEDSAFYSCKNASDSFDDGYELSNYSSNSSSNVGSYNFHEEEIEPPKPKMFQMYNNFMNAKGPFNYEMNPPAFGPTSGTNGMHNLNSQKSINLNSTFNHSGSKSFLMEPNLESNPSGTLFQDYQYFMKKQQEKQNKDEGDREKRLSKLVNSPAKHHIRVRRVYCNKKIVPMWASNLKDVEKLSREQKGIFNPHQIFGKFNVENLNLQEVFQTNDARFRKERGSSANWKKEYATPSTAKMKQKNGRISQDEFTNTKKQILFKSGLKSKGKMVDV